MAGQLSGQPGCFVFFASCPYGSSGEPWLWSWWGRGFTLPPGFGACAPACMDTGTLNCYRALHVVLLMQSTTTSGLAYTPWHSVQTSVVGILAPSPRIDAVYNPRATVSLFMWLCCSHLSDDSICHMQTSHGWACRRFASLPLVSLQTHFLLAQRACTSPQNPALQPLLKMLRL